jgi:hypothetical protein
MTKELKIAVEVPLLAVEEMDDEDDEYNNQSANRGLTHP